MINKTIQNRRTIPLFDTERSVDQSIVDQAIIAASWAPNHHLTEPWHFYQLGPKKTEQYIKLLYQVIDEYKGQGLAQKEERKGGERTGLVGSYLRIKCRE